jgi:hypothetical protein
MYTLARLAKGRDGKYLFHCGEGEAFNPPAWYEDACGQPQHPSVRFVPELPLNTFVNEVTAQHFAVVSGRWSETLREFGGMTNILCK